VLYVLNGTMVSAYPESGEVHRVPTGGAVYFGAGAWHHGFSYGTGGLRVLELFATDLLNPADYSDVITIGKIFHGSALLFRKEFSPDPALISGTYSGATVPMTIARRILEKLTTERILGPEGREKQLEKLTRDHLERLSRTKPGLISEVDGVGAMIAFRIGDGALNSTREFIQRCFDAGLVLYYGAHDPACVRLFLPAGVLTEDELGEAFVIMQRCLE